MLTRTQNNWNSFTAGSNVNWHNHFDSVYWSWKYIYDQEILLLGYSPTESYKFMQKQMCARLLIVALFIVVLNWKHPKHLLITECMILFYTHLIGYYRTRFPKGGMTDIWSRKLRTVGCLAASWASTGQMPAGTLSLRYDNQNWLQT